MADETPLAPVNVPRRGRKDRLVTLADLDQRTTAFRRVTEVTRSLTSDLGGDLSTAQQVLVQRIAVQAAMIEDFESRWARGESIDTGALTTMTNALRRNLETIGLKRMAKDATLDLHSYVERKYGTRRDDDDSAEVE